MVSPGKIPTTIGLQNFIPTMPVESGGAVLDPSSLVGDTVGPADIPWQIPIDPDPDAEDRVEHVLWSSLKRNQKSMLLNGSIDSAAAAPKAAFEDLHLAPPDKSVKQWMALIAIATSPSFRLYTLSPQCKYTELYEGEGRFMDEPTRNVMHWILMNGDDDRLMVLDERDSSTRVVHQVGYRAAKHELFAVIDEAGPGSGWQRGPGGGGPGPTSDDRKPLIPRPPYDSTGAMAEIEE